jgi:hypothetical protein
MLVQEDQYHIIILIWNFEYRYDTINSCTTCKQLQLGKPGKYNMPFHIEGHQ